MLGILLYYSIIMSNLVPHLTCCYYLICVEIKRQGPTISHVNIYLISVWVHIIVDGLYLN